MDKSGLQENWRTFPGIVREALGPVSTLLGTLFETAKDAIFLMDDMCFVDCNPATLAMFGCGKKEDIVGASPVDFSPPTQPNGSSSRERARALVTAALQGVPQEFEWRHCRLDRSEFDVEVRLNRCFVGGKSFLVAVVRDVTAHKRAENAVLQEKMFSERLIDSLPGIFYLYDEDLRLRRWNHNLEAFGFGAEELQGMKMEEWFTPRDYRERIAERAHRVLGGEANIDFVESDLVHKDGSHTPFLFSEVHIDAPGGPMLLGVGLSVADRVRAEKALEASERNYRELFNAAHDGLFIHDAEGQILEVNDSACAMFRVDPSARDTLTVGTLAVGDPPYSEHEAFEKIQRAVREGPQVFEWHCRRLDGTLFWGEIALQASRIAGNERIIASVRDITERKLAVLERERLMAELKAANHAKDEFLAMLSHELRTPLAAIAASASLLQEAPDDSGLVLQVAEVLERNTKLQARLVSDLLDTSRLTQGRLTMQPVPLELGSVVVAAVETCRADAESGGITLRAEVAPQLWVRADGDRIQQVVINLVVNSIKMTPTGGWVAVKASARNGKVVLVVEDTGLGIEASRQGEIFELFRKAAPAVRDDGGLGLGLFIAKSIVELHGGRIWAESQGRGCGSKFTVELPRGAAPGAAERGGVAPEPKRWTLLLLEDNADIRFLLGHVFSKLGFEVLSAGSGEEALALLQHESVDVILADIGLPGMNGYEFLRRARDLRTTAGALAYALTGYGQEADKQRSAEAGFIDHFIKPVDADAIGQRIRDDLMARHVVQ